MTDERRPITELEESCYEAAGIDPDDQTDEAQRQRMGVSMQTRFALEYLDDKKPPGHSKAGYHGMRRYVRYNMRRCKDEAEASDKPQFGFLLMIFTWLASWAFGKMADRVWAWWKSTHNAPELARTMLRSVGDGEPCGCYPPADYDDEDDQ